MTTFPQPLLQGIPPPASTALVSPCVTGTAAFVMKPISVGPLKQGWMPPVLLQLPRAAPPEVEVIELSEQRGDERVTPCLLLCRAPAQELAA
ncbi:hypothetical protein AAFF_G00153400 [Aldrovandia affinis]|uniref:Uncharacterized protein n=1 Tax=Aldrovandia affinis TaxID=143900 RepID=A0AAD7WWD6_9TELE|nr:hypothetical protein AAFF_G00153400 [Aldrovandia affinis]